MENNTTPPKEIWIEKQDAEYLALKIGIDYIRGSISSTNQYKCDTKYLSEQSVLEMLAEKDKEIERGKSELESQKHKIIGSLLESMNETHCEYHIEIVRNYLDNDI